LCGTRPGQAASNRMKTRQPEIRTVDVARDELQCIERARAGDAKAFGLLVERYQDRVFNVCVRILADRAAAEDLTQEAFVKAFTSITGFDGRAAFFTWLYRIAVNLCLSARRRPTRPTVSLDAESDGRYAATGAARLAGDGPSPDVQAARREEHGLVLAALAELDEEHRAVVVLRDIESLDYGEIAEILQVPTGTVKSRLHRARMALRERLGPILGKA